MSSALGYRGAQSVSDIGMPPGNNESVFSTQTPAGWAMIWLSIATLIILLVLWNL